MADAAAIKQKIAALEREKRGESSRVQTKLPKGKKIMGKVVHMCSGLKCRSPLCAHAPAPTDEEQQAIDKLLPLLEAASARDGYPITRPYAERMLIAHQMKLIPTLVAVKKDLDAQEAALAANPRLTFMSWDDECLKWVGKDRWVIPNAAKIEITCARDLMFTFLREEDEYLLDTPVRREKSMYGTGCVLGYPLNEDRQEAFKILMYENRLRNGRLGFYNERFAEGIEGPELAELMVLFDDTTELDHDNLYERTCKVVKKGHKDVKKMADHLSVRATLQAGKSQSCTAAPITIDAEAKTDFFQQPSLPNEVSAGIPLLYQPDTVLNEASRYLLRDNIKLACVKWEKTQKKEHLNILQKMEGFSENAGADPHEERQKLINRFEDRSVSLSRPLTLLKHLITLDPEQKELLEKLYHARKQFAETVQQNVFDIISTEPNYPVVEVSRDDESYYIEPRDLEVLERVLSESVEGTTLLPATWLTREMKQGIALRYQSFLEDYEKRMELEKKLVDKCNAQTNPDPAASMQPTVEDEVDKESAINMDALDVPEQAISIGDNVDGSDSEDINLDNIWEAETLRNRRMEAAMGGDVTAFIGGAINAGLGSTSGAASEMAAVTNSGDNHKDDGESSDEDSTVAECDRGVAAYIEQEADGTIASYKLNVSLAELHQRVCGDHIPRTRVPGRKDVRHVVHMFKDTISTVRPEYAPFLVNLCNGSGALAVDFYQKALPKMKAAIEVDRKDQDESERGWMAYEVYGMGFVAAFYDAVKRKSAADRKAEKEAART